MISKCTTGCPKVCPFQPLVRPSVYHSALLCSLASEELEQHGSEHLVRDAVPFAGEAPVTAAGQPACDRRRPAGEVVAAALAVEDQSRDADRAEQGGRGGVRDRAV